MSERTPLLIDTDPGVDDALAILMALSDPGYEVVGLSIAAGNVGLDNTVANALKLCEVADADVRVYAGCPGPLVHPARDAAYVHGRNGFGDTGYEAAARPADTEHAARAILRLSHEYTGRLVLVALAPLTNIALALKLDPSLPERIARFVVMGGAVTGHGNITPAAEFNIYFDPEAAHIVFDSFPMIDLSDWEATVAHGFAHDAIDEWVQAGNPIATFYGDISRQTRAWARGRCGDAWHAADPLAMAYALEAASALETVTRPVSIELDGANTRGATIVDWRREGGGRDNCRILMRYDQGRFEHRMQHALGVLHDLR